MPNQGRGGFGYYSGGKLVKISFSRSAALLPAVPAARGVRGRRLEMGIVGGSGATALDSIRASLGKSEPRRALFRGSLTAETLRGRAFGPGTVVIPTDTLVVEGAKSAEVRRLQEKHGTELVSEGTHGKVLLRVPADVPDPVLAAFEIARETYKRGVVSAAHPNFVRAYRELKLSTPAPEQWNLDNSANPGLRGADVHALAAWTITKGSPSVKVAVLDEGVDTQHPDLAPAVVAERDFVDGNAHGRPDGNDAHGTACAGIIASRSSKFPGIGPELSLIAVRIAKDDGRGNWIFDDFLTADAIDWAWTNGADVLSNSWGGGPPVDVITNAFERARTRGRDGKGSVIVVAAGNSQAPVDFPGNLANVLTVGASNQWDERKTQTTKDREDWWGSNYGKELDLLAPGVAIATTDIRGSKGYESGDHTLRFNGTSAATPHVAAAAALMLSVAPTLKESRVREIIAGMAELLPGQKRWTPQAGSGRLNTYTALRAARRG